MTQYLLDANVFIEAKRRYYGFGICPAFWDWLVLENGRQHVFSIEKVADELVQGQDELVDWTKARGDGFFVPIDSSVVNALGEVARWASTANYTSAARTVFLESADYYLVAHARAHGHTIVTHERADPRPSKVKIPDACIEFGIKFTTPWAMLGQLGARFVLSSPSRDGQ